MEMQRNLEECPPFNAKDFETDGKKLTKDEEKEAKEFYDSLCLLIAALGGRRLGDKADNQTAIVQPVYNVPWVGY